MMKPRFLTLAGMIVMAAAVRLAPHPWNMTPVAAMALFSGAHFRDPYAAFGVPLLAMVLSDVVLGFHSLAWVVYGCFALTVLIGTWIKRRFSFERIVLGSGMASVLFFAITNFGVWMVSGLYPRTAQGLAACYLAGIPFFRNTLFGDLAYTGILFGGFLLAERLVPVLREEPSC
jgi:hypothetical protein